MDDRSARFALPLLAAGQAQKEVLHNEALTTIDALLHAAVETIGDQAPPSAPIEGRSWIVGPAPSGAWVGQAGAVATWTAGGWRFAAPVEGMRIWVSGPGIEVRYGPGGWSDGTAIATRLMIGGVQVVGPRRPGIAPPSGGSTIDVDARSVLGIVLSALQFHGLIEA